MSILRIMVPVALFGAGVAVLYFVTDEFVVAPAANKAEAIKNDIQKRLNGSTNHISQSINDNNGKLQASLMAQDFDITGRHLSDVVIEFYDRSGHPSAILLAPGMQFTGAASALPTSSASRDWRLDPGSKLIRFNPLNESNLGSVYPDEVGPEPPESDHPSGGSTQEFRTR